MKSMTGYGEASQNVQGAKVTVQIRSLNHRHLDLQLRVPREYLSFEEEIRKSVREKISRGRIDLFVNRYGPKTQTRKLELDDALVGQYIAGVKQLKKKYQLAGEVGVAMLANLPELFHVREMEADHASERQALLKALGSALKKLERSREREGAQLKADMESQIEHISRIAAALEERAAEIGVRAQKAPVAETPATEKSGGRVHGLCRVAWAVDLAGNHEDTRGFVHGRHEQTWPQAGGTGICATLERLGRGQAAAAEDPGNDDRPAQRKRCR